jgi:PAS domain S-box-containing protein
MSISVQQQAVQGQGELPDLVRAFDWSTTSLGPIESWSKELLCIVNVLLASPIPTLIYWGESLTLLYNDAARPIASNKHPGALGASARDVWKEAWHIIGPEVEQVISTGVSVRHEGVLVPLEKEGQLQDMYWNYSYSPIYKDGAIGGALLICQEITASFLSERSLRVSEARADRILKSIGDAVIVTDAETRIMRMNPVAEALTGWQSEEAKGRPLAEIFRIVNEATRQPVESPADKVKRLGTIVGLASHTILIAKDGTENQIDDSGAPITDENGTLAGVVLVFRDVNERRELEREREILAVKLDRILEATTDAVAILDQQWRFTYLNSRGRQILRPTGDVLGKEAWKEFPAMVYPDSPYVYHYHRAMSEGIGGEFVTEYPDPLNISLRIMVRPSPDGIIIFFRDITEQKRKDALLIQTEKLAAVGRMASSIAHEINNPLEAVTNLLYIAQRSATMEEVRPLLDTADQELRRVASIVNQTLRFHRQSSYPQSVSCLQLFVTVLDIYQSRFKNMGIAVEKRKRANKPIEIYEGDIRQVLNNLVGNAVDAMPRGGRLLVRSREATDWRTGRKGLTLTIADTGTGMNAQTQARIFEAFFTTKGIGGTGLGLWVSAEITARHQGRLRLRSCQQEGRTGTVATLFLPFHPSEKITS